MPEKAAVLIREPERLFTEPRPLVEKTADGSTLVRSAEALEPIGRSITDWLVDWAAKAPDRAFLQERESAAPGSPWRKLTYAKTLTNVEKIAAGLLSIGLSSDRPLAILSDNSIDHALLTLAALHIGVPVTPVSPAYSLQSRRCTTRPLKPAASARVSKAFAAARLERCPKSARIPGCCWDTHEDVCDGGDCAAVVVATL